MANLIKTFGPVEIYENCEGASYKLYAVDTHAVSGAPVYFEAGDFVAPSGERFSSSIDFDEL